MSGDVDRIKGSLESFVRGIFPTIDYLARYPSKVVAQNGDGTLELVPDDARLPGLSNVPVRYGVPDTKAVVQAGARVLLGFAGGDPSKPIAELWELASITSLTLGASGTTQPAACGQDVRDELDAIWYTLANMTLPVTGSTAGPNPALNPTPNPAKKTVKSGKVNVAT